MKKYANKIALLQNTRGVWCLDTTMGCASGMAATPGGCYGDCYAAKSAKFYGYDFTKTVLRHFTDNHHAGRIVRAINSIKAPFVRIGCGGDPSENWEHTVAVIKKIQWCNKEIVIITRHWNLLSDYELEFFSDLNICINSSVSALDSYKDRERAVAQYLRIQKHCKSVLRIISCSFNTENEQGRRLALIQERLFEHDVTLDTVFRPSKNNPLVTSGTILTSHEKFNGRKTTLSKFMKKTYTGKCHKCPDQCGVFTNSPHTYNRRGILEQATLI